MVYAFPTRNANAVALGCTRSQSLEHAGDDLLFLRSLPGSAQKDRVSGTVSHVRTLTGAFDQETQPLSAIHVVVANGSEKFDIITNVHGVFELADLKPGNYQVQVALPAADFVYFSCIIGKASPLSCAFPPEQQLGPFFLAAKAGVEVDFFVGSQHLLMKPARKNARTIPNGS